VNVAASTGITFAIAVYSWRRRREWLARRFDRDDRLVLIFGMVLVANAVISYPYTKDVIMSPAGVFFAVAAFAALRGWTSAWPSMSTVRRGALLALCAV